MCIRDRPYTIKKVGLENDGFAEIRKKAAKIKKFLVIKNFKVKDVPTFAKLLTLADFGGISDLLSGDGISFEKLEINTINDGKVLKINEIFAVGPSISILIDGYIDKKTGLVSLRGTMVPAKDLNKLISKIPLLGDILIPKDIGEGLFGVSFKMKGVPLSLIHI